MALAVCAVKPRARSRSNGGLYRAGRCKTLDPITRSNAWRGKDGDYLVLACGVVGGLLRRRRRRGGGVTQSLAAHVEPSTSRFWVLGPWAVASQNELSWAHGPNLAFFQSTYDRCQWAIN